jgi:hypothetical protein
MSQFTNKIVTGDFFKKLPESIMDGKTIQTKREVLRITMSLFDPLRFLSPVTIASRILMLEIWKPGLGWDDQLSKTLFEKWQKWLKQLQQIKDVKVPRCFSKYLILAQDVQFHVFCDASEQTYTAVNYLRIEAENIEVALVVSKARVSLRAVTIPKMELMAAVLGSRLLTAMKIRVIWRIHKSKFLSDETKQPIICDERVRRGDWPIGRLVNVLPGDDGVVRVAKVKYAHGYIQRPVTKLAVISLNDGCGDSIGMDEPIRGGECSKGATSTI